MKKSAVRTVLALSTLFPLTLGCDAKSENQVLVDPNAGTEAQQKELEDYDKQQQAADGNYQ